MGKRISKLVLLATDCVARMVRGGTSETKDTKIRKFTEWVQMCDGRRKTDQG